MTLAIIDARPSKYIIIAAGAEVGGASAAQSAASAEIAQLARDAALAASNFIDGGIAAGEAATTTGQFFTVESPAGVLSYRIRTGGGSTEVASTPTQASVAAQFAPFAGRDVNTRYLNSSNADPTGVADSGAAFASIASAAGAGGKIVVAPGIYLVNQQINILDFQTWVMDGVTLKHTNDAINILSASGKEGWSILGRLKLQGTLTAVTNTPTNEKGLYIANCKRFRVEGVEARNFKGSGIHMDGIGSQFLRGDRGAFSDCSAVSCVYGIYVDVGPAAEYNTWSNINVSGCVTGVRMHAGNNTWVGGSIVDNKLNLELPGGGNNHGHGAFIGTNINHAGGAAFSGVPYGDLFNLVATDVGNGYTFVGCHFYENIIYLNECQGISILGGILDCPVYNDIGGNVFDGFNAIRDNFIPTGGTGFTLLSNDAGLSQMMVSGNYTKDGPHSLNQQSPVYVLAARSTGGQSAGSGAVIIFNSEAFDLRGAYNTATGIFTAPVQGTYEVIVNITATGTAATMGGGYIGVEVNSVADTYLAYGGATPAGDTVVGGGVAHVFCTVGQTIRITSSANGTSPVVAAGVSRLSIRLLGE